MHKSTAAIAVTLTLVAGGVTARAAAAGPPDGAARLKHATAAVQKYSDADVLQVLLAAQGPVAQASPDLVRVLGFSADKPHTDDKALRELIQAYLRYDPSFHGHTAVPLQSGDPTRVDAALRSFSTAFDGFIKQSSGAAAAAGKEVQLQPNGWFYMGAYVAVYANALAAANAAVYANAAVATNALATLVIVTWYLPDASATSTVERDAFVKALTDALS